MKLHNPFTGYSFDQALSDFLNAKQPLSKNTLKSYKRTLRYYRLYVGDKWPPQAGDIDNFLAASKARGLGKASLHNQYRNIRTWLNWLESRGKLQNNPIRLITAPPKYNPLPRAVPVDHLQDFFGAIVQSSPDDRFSWHKARDMALFLLLLETGMRLGELTKLTLVDVDLEQRTARIRDAKGDQDRLAVFNNARVARVLSAWLSERSTLPLPSGLESLFVVYNCGEWLKMGKSAVWHARNKYCQAVGLKPFRVHDFRHSFAVYAMRGRADLLDVQKQLGHSSLEVTQRYTLVEDVGRVERHAVYSPTRYILS